MQNKKYNKYSDARTTKNLQRQQELALIEDDNTFEYLDLIIDLISNKNLHPEVFAIIFPRYKDFFNWSSLKYNNCETQHLLEVSILLQ